MKVDELRELIKLRRPPAPYGARSLTRACSIEDLRGLARRRVPRSAMDYIEGGGEGEVTLRRNRTAFDDFDLVPRVLRDVSKVDLTTEVLGTPMPFPFALGPVGSPRLFHHEGELAAVRAASRAGAVFCLSSSATQSIERVAAEASCPLWYQVYVWKRRGIVEELLGRARAAGYRVLVVTVDTAVNSKRERELRSGLMLPNPALRLSTILDGAMHPSWWWHFLTSNAIRFEDLAPPGAAPSLGFARMVRGFDGSFSWRDLEWIRNAWDGPVVLKGIMSVADARRAVDAGLDGVVVSNHGGRQLDHVSATIEALGPIVSAVGDRIEVLMDGGIRRGTDILTALALGAKACLIGRAYAYGLAAAGEAGVNVALDLLAQELGTAMALSGLTSVGEIDPTYVRSRKVMDLAGDSQGSRGR